MKLDALVLKRFDELLRKADSVERTTRSVGGYSYIQGESFNEWAISCLGLMDRVFGGNSVHFENFNETYRGSGNQSSSFLECRGIFKAAKEDYEGGYLFRLKALVEADVLEDVLDQA